MAGAGLGIWVVGAIGKKLSLTEIISSVYTTTIPPFIFSLYGLISAAKNLNAYALNSSLEKLSEIS